MKLAPPDTGNEETLSFVLPLFLITLIERGLENYFLI